MPTGHLREGDVDLLLRVLERTPDGAGDPAQGLPWALLQGLLELIRCDVDVGFQQQITADRTSVLVQACGAGSSLAGGPVPDPAGGPFWQLWHTSMCSGAQRSGVQRAGDQRTGVRLGDVVGTGPVRPAEPMHGCLDAVRYAMTVSLRAPAGAARAVLFLRSSGAPFGERERQLGVLLRPHLQERWLQTAQRRRGVPHLSDREWQVLELAASGLSYADVAARLFLSPGTVRKHMEHVRERLGVHSVAAAAARALPRPAGPVRAG